MTLSGVQNLTPFNSKDVSQILGQLSSAVCVINTQCQLLYLNSAAENILQMSAARALKQNLNDVVTLPEGFFEQILKSAQELRPFAQRESVWIIHDRAITLDLVVTPVVKEQNAHTLILELQVVDRILRISRDEKTHHSHQAHRALIRGLAHEVKNPLGAIRGASQLLERCIEPELYEYTQVIIKEVDRLSKLVDSMLGPRNPLNVQICNIHEIIEHVIQLIAVQHETNFNIKTLEIKKNYDLSLPELFADRDRLIQAILNIMTNAQHALYSSEFSTSHPTITISTKVARQMTLHQQLHKVVFHVIIEDNGPGIPENIMLSLFYPLVSGRADGSGIGLSIAQHVLQQHGGIVECNSKPGCTQFHLFLPAQFLPLGGDQ